MQVTEQGQHLAEIRELQAQVSKDLGSLSIGHSLCPSTVELSHANYTVVRAAEVDGEDACGRSTE